MAKYNEEKVLYFCNRHIGLHVSCDEPKGSDLTEIVATLLGKGQIEKLNQDDGGEYFGITKLGEIALLEKQIAWRERNGKKTSEHHRKLSELTTQGI
jgi:hypothetical protein